MKTLTIVLICIICFFAFITGLGIMLGSAVENDYEDNVNTDKVNQMNYNYLAETQGHLSWFMMLAELDTGMITDTAYGIESIDSCTLWMQDSEGLYNQVGQDLNGMTVPLKYVAVHNKLEDSVLHMEMAVGYLGNDCGDVNNINKATEKIIQATDEINEVTALLQLM